MKFGVCDFRITFSSAKDLEGFVAEELFIEAGGLVNEVGFVAQFDGNEGRWPEDLTADGHTAKESLCDDSFC